LKTIRFGKINVEPLENGDALLQVSAPGQGMVELPLTFDELLIFLVEVGNQMDVSKETLTKLRIQKDLENEKNKSKASDEDSEDTGEEV